MSKPKLEIMYLSNYKLEEWGELKYQYNTDSGFDLRAAIHYQQLLRPSFIGYNLVVSSGIKFKIPKGYEVVIRPRSGLAAKGIVSAYGTIDESYRGEVKIILFNLLRHGFIINPGDRIAQAILQKKIQANLISVKAFSDETDRNENGFGSTGNN